MQTASGYTLYYTPVPCHYAFAPCLCMHTPVVYSGIMAFTLYIYDAPNKLFKDNNNKKVGCCMTKQGGSPMVETDVCSGP